MGNELALLSKASQALSAAKTLDDIVKLRDQAEALRSYIKAQCMGLEMQNDAAELKLRAERKAGEILAKTQKNKGAATRLHDVTASPKLSELGIEKIQSHRWQRIAEIEDESFEGFISDTKESGQELTEAGALRLNQKAKRKAKIRSIGKAAELSGVFSVILADPPWRYEDCVTESREIENHYPTMDVGEICELPIQKIADSDCILFLWTTSPKLEEGLLVLNSWGFNYKTCAVWDKQSMGMGYYFRQQHELLLVATRGELPTPPPEARPRSIITAKRSKHSEKPEIVHEIIEQMYPDLPKVELFARAQREGWTAWGNQSEATEESTDE